MTKWLAGQPADSEILLFRDSRIFQICSSASCAFIKTRFPLPQWWFHKSNLETNFFFFHKTYLKCNDILSLPSFEFTFHFTNLFLYIKCQCVAVRFWEVCRVLFIYLFLISSRLQWVLLRRIWQMCTDPLSKFSLPIKCIPLSPLHSHWKSCFLP